jgi:Fe-S cluster assembly protein SufD
MNTEKTTEIKKHYINIFDAFENSLDGECQSKIRSIRKQAIAQFSQMDFPTIKNEEWKYTNISPLFGYSFKQAKKIEVQKYQVEQYLFDEAHFYTLVFVNGKYSEKLSNIGKLDKGVEISNLSSAIKSSAGIDEYIGKLADSNKNIFTALSTSFLEDGTFIKIPDNIVVEKPIQILYVTAGNEEVISNPRNLFMVGKNSQVKIIETYFALAGAAYFTNAVTEIKLSENAIVEHIKIQDENLKSFHISSIEIEQDRTSKFSSYNINFGGLIVRNNINAKFSNEYSECNLNGLYLAQENQLIDNHTLIDHAKPHCLSNELYKGILDGKSRGVFNGKVMVRQDAQKTNAFQQNKTILLSTEALMNTKPQLEIFADDVKCSHGATVGQLDKDALFYLRSRGLGIEEAKVILIYAFASDVVQSISIKEVRCHLEELLASKLL